MTSLSTPFSLATASTTNNSSLLIAELSSKFSVPFARPTINSTSFPRGEWRPIFSTSPVLATASSPILDLARHSFPGLPALVALSRRRRELRHQLRLVDVRLRNAHRLAILLEHDRRILYCEDRALEPPPTVDRQVHFQLCRFADEPCELRRRVQ